MSRLVLHDGYVDVDAGRVVRGGEEVALTGMEQRVLHVLADANGAVVARERLVEVVWGWSASAAVVEKTMQRLRAKLEADPKRPRHVRTVHGEGYRLVAEVADRAPDLVGREREEAAVRAALAEPGAKVTLLGPGGVGKTALARAVAGGAPFVDLVGVTGDERVLLAVAAAIGLTGGARTVDDLRRSVASALARQPGPVVVDDAESDADAVRRLVAATSGRLLVTSRVRLDVPGERVIELGPLDPAAARALYRRRARGDLPDALLERLEGLPLAIELAAGWSHEVAPDALAARIDDLDLPAREVDRPARHSSLRAVVAASVGQLDDGERDALLALACFRSTFDLVAAEAVLEGTGDGSAPDPANAAEPPAIERLQALVDRSLVGRTTRVVSEPFRDCPSDGQLAEGPDTPRVPPSASARAPTRAGLRRFTLSGPVRRFLASSPPPPSAVLRWRSFVLDRVEAWLRAGPGFRARAELHLDDLVAIATDDASAPSDADAVREASPSDADVVRAVDLVLEVVRVRGASALAEELAERAVAAGTRAGPRHEAIARRELAFARRLAGRWDDAIAEATRAVALAADFPRERATAAKALALALHLRGRNLEAELAGMQAVGAAEGTGEPWLLARCRTDLAVVRSALGRPDEALEAEARAAYRALGDGEGEAKLLATAAQRALDHGDADAAEAHAAAALDIARQQGLPGLAGVCRATLAMVAWERGDVAGARRQCADVAGDLAAMGSQALAEQVLAWAAALRAIDGEPEAAIADLRALTHAPAMLVDGLVAVVEVSLGLEPAVPRGFLGPVVAWAEGAGPEPQAPPGEIRRLVSWLRRAARPSSG